MVKLSYLEISKWWQILKKKGKSREQSKKLQKLRRDVAANIQILILPCPELSDNSLIRFDIHGFDIHV